MLTVAARFRLSAPPVSCEPYGNGHINRTYLLVDQNKRRYILQKINDAIFRDIPALMKNISLVTEYLRGKDGNPRHVMRLVKTDEGADYLHNEAGYFRVYDFIEGSICLERAESQADFAQSAAAFGGFQRALSGFDASALSETLPGFHDTVNRVALLKKAAQADACGRLKDARREYEFAMARADEAGSLLRMLDEGKLRLRVTHNDTKLNNVLLDAATREALCVIDLDTVMPGLAANDFGDSIRFGAATAAEDETDLSRVSVSLPLYRAYARAFLRACAGAFDETEIHTLPMGAKLMTYECGVRFLTDYLSGDTYFRIHREKHNLDRCRTQFKLVEDTENKWTEIMRMMTEEATL